MTGQIYDDSNLEDDKTEMKIWKTASVKFETSIMKEAPPHIRAANVKLWSTCNFELFYVIDDFDLRINQICIFTDSTICTSESFTYSRYCFKLHPECTKCSCNGTYLGS